MLLIKLLTGKSLISFLIFFCVVYRKAAGYPDSIRKDIRETNQGQKPQSPLKWPDSHILPLGITPSRILYLMGPKSTNQVLSRLY